MNINFMNQTDEEKWKNYRRYLRPILTKTLTTLERSTAVNVNVILVTPQQIHELNKQFRNIDRPTDVLSFEDGEVEDDTLSLGDIFINVRAIEQQAEDYGHSIKREFCFLVVHGYLHLLGFDHHTPEEEIVMFGYQEEILHGIADRITQKTIQ